jgi:hypothetical protein
MEDVFGHWKAENYIAAAGVAVGAAGLAAGQRPAEGQVVQAPVPFKRTKYDITMPIFRAEGEKRKILTMKTECKSNWWGNGFNSMVYDLLFFELETLKIFNDTTHMINDDYLYVLDKNVVNENVIRKLHKSGFKNELQCYDLNEKELYQFLIHYEHKAFTNEMPNKNVHQSVKVKVKANKNMHQSVKVKTNKNVHHPVKVKANKNVHQSVKVKVKTNKNMHQPVKVKSNKNHSLKRLSKMAIRI